MCWCCAGRTHTQARQRAAGVRSAFDTERCSGIDDRCETRDPVNQADLRSEIAVAIATRMRAWATGRIESSIRTIRILREITCRRSVAMRLQQYPGCTAVSSATPGILPYEPYQPELGDTIDRVCTLLFGQGGLTLTRHPHPSPHRPSPSPTTLTLQPAPVVTPLATASKRCHNGATTVPPRQRNTTQSHRLVLAHVDRAAAAGAAIRSSHAACTPLAATRRFAPQFGACLVLKVE
eukprot:COSAG02_NODE_2648_length_8336_cov_3.970378_6_plen_236_part_00